jgi:hypothetical protein
MAILLSRVALPEWPRCRIVLGTDATSGTTAVNANGIIRLNRMDPACEP